VELVSFFLEDLKISKKVISLFGNFIQNDLPVSKLSLVLLNLVLKVLDSSLKVDDLLFSSLKLFTKFIHLVKELIPLSMFSLKSSPMLFECSIILSLEFNSIVFSSIDGSAQLLVKSFHLLQV